MLSSRGPFFSELQVQSEDKREAWGEWVDSVSMRRMHSLGVWSLTCCEVIRRICMEGFNDQREGTLGKRERMLDKPEVWRRKKGRRRSWETRSGRRRS